MKTLKLKALNIGVEELLSREQMRKVLGGRGSSDKCDCNNDDGCKNSSDGKVCRNCGSNGSGGQPYGKCQS